LLSPNPAIASIISFGAAIRIADTSINLPIQVRRPPPRMKPAPVAMPTAASGFSLMLSAKADLSNISTGDSSCDCIVSPYADIRRMT
jgi:hypothetical protein